MFSAPRHSIPLFPKAIFICNILMMMMIAADADADDGADDGDHDLKLALPPLCRCG